MAVVKLIGNDDGAGTSSGTANYHNLQRFICVLSGQMTSFNIRTSDAGNVKVAIYSDDGGEPNILLTSIESSVVAGVNSISIGPVSLTKDTYYWLAYNSDAAIVRYKTGTCTRRSKSATYSTFSFPNPAGTGYSSSTTNSRIISGWGTESAAGCPRQAMHMRRLM